MELERLGLDLATISFAGTIVFGILGLFSVWSQTRRIWRMRSGLSVPVSAYMYLTASFTAGLIYGITTDRVAMIFLGVTRTPFCIAILEGLRRFRGFSRVDKVSGWLLAAVIAAMCFSGRKDLFFSAFMLGLVPLSLVQPWELWRNKRSGAADPYVLWVFLFSAIFWTLYWWVAVQAMMVWINIILTFVAFTTLVLYYRYREGEKHAA